MASSQCWNCSKPIDANNFARLDSCEGCGKDTHVCKNCFFYDRMYNNECKESSADRVIEKEKSNFCDFFKPSDRAGGSVSSADALRAAAEALFKKS